jgi:hypothetical protein
MHLHMNDMKRESNETHTLPYAASRLLPVLLAFAAAELSPGLLASADSGEQSWTRSWTYVRALRIG